MGADNIERKHSMSNTAKFAIALMTASQSQKHVTFNTAIQILDAFLQAAIIDRDLSAPPGGESDGDMYLVSGTGTGAWATHDGEIALYVNGGYLFYTLIEGMAFWVSDENVYIVYNGSGFDEFAGATSAGSPIIVAAGDETTDVAAATGVVTFRAPYAMTLTGVRASLKTASTSGAVTVDINKNGTTVLSTKLTLDQDEKTSVTAATPAVISVASFADDDEITIDVDGAGVGAVGLKVQLNHTVD